MKIKVEYEQMVRHHVEIEIPEDEYEGWLDLTGEDIYEIQEEFQIITSSASGASIIESAPSIQILDVT